MDIIPYLVALYVILPAYLPNSAAVIVGGSRPIDGGRDWRGARILGDGKTWRGTIGGILAGTGLALILNVVRGVIGIGFLPEFTFVAALALSTGAMLGDIGASFIKRRSGRERGAAFPGLDQLDFLIGAIVMTVLLAGGWLWNVLGMRGIVFLLLVTPVVHLTANRIGFRLGLKDEPW